MPTAFKIIETSFNRFYLVKDSTDPNLAHCYIGTELKRSRSGTFTEKNSRIELVRKAATKIIDANPSI